MDHCEQKLLNPLTLKEGIHSKPKAYIEHICSNECINEAIIAKSIPNVILLDYYIHIRWENPYTVPIYFGWKRIEKPISYITPCGLQLTKVHKIYNYLIKTRSNLSIDQFVLDSKIKLFNDLPFFNAFIHINDISFGNEAIPIECINEIDHTSPNFVYSIKRVLAPGIQISFDDDFLSCCSCDNDCFDKNNCDCHLRCIEEALMLEGSESVENAGYKFKKLNNSPLSAIYECNHKCKCSSKCLNRVAQNGIKHRFQVYKTAHKGWALRCLHDIPQGSFICLYSGEIITNNMVDDPERSDEYIAALDYIEASRKPKLDYNEELDGLSLSTFSSSSSSETLSLRNHLSENTEDFIDIDIDMDQSNNMNMNITLFEPENSYAFSDNIKTTDYKDDKETESEIPLVFKQYGEIHNFCIDGNKIGNIGRFLNHSCEPNCRIRNIFIDCHDYRLPILAFFSTKRIKAMEELTWDYHYNPETKYINSKRCFCESKLCKGVIY